VGSPDQTTELVAPPQEAVDAGNPGDPDNPTPPPPKPPGPWPTTAALNYTATYGLGFVQSVGVDDAYNIWLLNGDRIGVLRPGTNKPVWTAAPIGQAAPGFGVDKLATYSTVICGGAADQAYVGYATTEPVNPKWESVTDPEFLKGDMDVVQLNPNGTITLTEHLSKSAGSSQPWPPLKIGIHNSNDWHYDEDRTVLVCKKVMQGRDKGELYIGTNHGVTRIQGLFYNSHRHPDFYNPPGVLRMAYSHGLGFALNGDVLIANDWMIGMVAPPEALVDWENIAKVPWKLKTHNEKLNGQMEFDFWRGFEQTADGNYYLGSSQYGLWQMTPGKWGDATWVTIPGVPTSAISALAATADGSLYVGTDNEGLWRMDAQKKFSRVSGVVGSRVREGGLVYDPTVSPAMLYVLTNDALTVLRIP
ncbi:MAG TPA: hypothetical protein VE549_01550, partial [Myxococcaceae bacterium]|nr:hypothetical protein [Myxococcaceae bacterium]